MPDSKSQSDAADAGSTSTWRTPHPAVTWHRLQYSLARAILTRTSWARPTAMRCQFGAFSQFGACQFDARQFDSFNNFYNANRQHAAHFMPHVTISSTMNRRRFIVDSLNASVCVTDLYIGQWFACASVQNRRRNCYV